MSVIAASPGATSPDSTTVDLPSVFPSTRSRSAGIRIFQEPNPSLQSAIDACRQGRNRRLQCALRRCEAQGAIGHQQSIAFHGL